MLAAALAATATRRKRCERPPMDEWTNKAWSPRAREHHPAIKTNGILPFATTWMDPEGLMLSQRSQTEKKEIRMISRTGGIWKPKLMDKQNRTSLADAENKPWVSEGKELGWAFFKNVRPGDWEEWETALRFCPCLWEARAASTQLTLSPFKRHFCKGFFRNEVWGKGKQNLM